jgi:DNA repair protein RecO (recombination protein O)
MPEFRTFRAESIVLKHHDWGEADRILTVFTREHGKLRIVARGVRKIRSRRAGHLEPFTHVMLQLAKSKDLPIVTQADTLESFSTLREDLEAIGHASYVVELLDRFTYQEGENLPLFNLFKRTLERLAARKAPAELVLRYFEMRLLDQVGFRPELFGCVVCGEEIRAENQYFSAALGGIVCPRSAGGKTGLTPISVDALKFLRHFQRSTFSEATRAQPSPAAEREMEVVMQHYLTYVLERGLNTPGFMQRIKNTR